MCWSSWKKITLSHADLYLAFDLSDYQQSYAQYYKGNVYYKQKMWDEAQDSYEAAWRANKLKRAKTKLERVKERRAQESAG
jgi:hypothetical protein